MQRGALPQLSFLTQKKREEREFPEEVCSFPFLCFLSLSTIPPTFSKINCLLFPLPNFFFFFKLVVWLLWYLFIIIVFVGNKEVLINFI